MPPNNPIGGATPNVPVVPTVPTAGASQSPVPPARRQGNQPIDQKLLFNRNQAVFRRVYHKTVRPGALITFQYLNWQHDPYPLVLSTGVWSDGKVAGVNLHYLTFRYVRALINQHCGRAFSYENVKGNQFIKNSFRSYKRDGLRNLKLLDCEFLMWMMGQVRSFNPTEVQAIRQWVQQQMRQRLTQYTAQDLERMTQQYQQELPDVLNPNLQGQRYGQHNLPGDFGNQSRPTFDDGRRNPGL